MKLGHYKTKKAAKDAQKWISKESGREYPVVKAGKGYKLGKRWKLV